MYYFPWVVYECRFYCTKELAAHDTCVYSLPNDKILNSSKLKALPECVNMTKTFEYICKQVENIIGKGKNAGNCLQTDRQMDNGH